MCIFELDINNAPIVAKMMERIKPDWWSFDSALMAITAPDIIGWYMGESFNTPMGFMHAKELKAYSCIELENFGFDDNGVFHTGDKLAILFDKVEQYALENDFRSVRVTITYHKEFSHSNTAINYADELSNIKSSNYLLLNRNYRPAGFIPDCFGADYHGLMILKYLYE